MNLETNFTNNPYPNSSEIRRFLNNPNDEILEYFIILWLSEGIPKIALKDPEKYQKIRSQIASHLGIHSKAITLIGSARLGYSLSPSNYGREFIPNESDLDLCIVDEKIFLIFTEEFNKWMNDYAIGRIVAPNDGVKKLWDENLLREPKKIIRGIFDLNRIPAFSRYPKGRALLNYLSIITRNWNIENDKIKLKKITVRFYKDWNCFVSQNKLNLRVFNQI